MRERSLNSSAKPPGRLPTVEVSWGELIDKITILEIKEQRLTSPQAVVNVRKELAALSRALGELVPAPAALDALKHELKAVNGALWDIENRTRAKEAAKTFDREFIELTRSVYLNNDQRARIKRRINELLNSGLVEEKQYTPYAT
jgi:post-segregation antitoxin (ccd killing protein)